MVAVEIRSEVRTLRCLDCGGALTPNSSSLRCDGCGSTYPVVAGIPILVKEPIDYLRSQIALLNRASDDAKRRRAELNASGRKAGLTDAALDRHRDVIDAELARASMFRTLLEPAAKMLEGMPECSAESRVGRRAGWSFDALLPYLLRDWTSTPELEAASSIIGSALANIFPNPAGVTMALAGCGAGGLLSKIPAGFERVLGFDLTLPVLMAARQLLDGKKLELALPRTINTVGHLSLQSNAISAGKHCKLLAMDALETAFSDGSVDCVVTSFLIDLLPDPRRLADEIYRILSPDGVWINYGPSGPLKAIWRFDQREGAAFFENAGFAVIHTDAYRATYLDLSRDCPGWSFQSHMCYLISARKTGRVGEEAKVVMPTPAELPQIIPSHFPGATLITRKSVTAQHKNTIHLRLERPPGIVENMEIDSDTAQIIALVDGKRTILEIAALSKQSQTAPVEEIILAFERYFQAGLLRWHEQ